MIIVEHTTGWTYAKNENTGASGWVPAWVVQKSPPDEYDPAASGRRASQQEVYLLRFSTAREMYQPGSCMYRSIPFEEEQARTLQRSRLFLFERTCTTRPELELLFSSHTTVPIDVFAAQNSIKTCANSISHATKL